MAGAYDYSNEQKLLTVHDFLNTYRYVYEQSVKPYDRKLAQEAYQKLFDVENRTDDLMEAQIIMEKEHLVLNTVTADYKQIVEDFMDAADPNYEVTSAAVKATIGAYASATSLEEITYMSEVAKATCDDIAVQVKLKVEMMAIFISLIIAWEKAKERIRDKNENPEPYAKAMVLTRRQMKQYYRFLSEDMGITFDIMERTPFYRISMLDPKGLDELWRIKKVMHPDNIKAIKYILFEEILSDKTMEEILLTPQPYPFYQNIDTAEYSYLDDDYQAIAEELNKDKKYFRQNRGSQNPVGVGTLIDKTNKLTKNVAASIGNPGGMSGAASGAYSSAVGSMSGAVSEGTGMESGMKNAFSDLSGMSQSGSDPGQNAVRDIAKSVAADAAKEVGKGLLRGLFRR